MAFAQRKIPPFPEVEQFIKTCSIVDYSDKRLVVVYRKSAGGIAFG